MKKFNLLLVALFISIFHLSAQIDNVSFIYSPGKVFLHSKKLNIPVPEFSQKFELAFEHSLNSGDSSFLKRGKMIFGLNIGFLDYGMNSVFGKVYSLYPSLSFVFPVSKKLHWEFKLGFGLGYITKFYDKIPWSDTIFNGVGQHLNNFTVLAPKIVWSVSKKSKVDLGFSLSHLSSGAFVQPNYGINLVGGQFGYSYHFQSSKPSLNFPSYAPLRAYRNYVSLGISQSSISNHIHIKYPNYHVQYKHAILNSQKLASWLFGFEYVFSSIKKANYIRTAPYIDMPSNLLNYSSVYGLVGREWFIKKFGLNLTMGLGMDGDTKKFVFMQKPQLVYYPFIYQYQSGNVIENLFLSIELNARLSVAQYAQITCGFWF